MPRNEYQYISIPTIYAGVTFRSRLEARWAAFADLAGWEWKYEPIDFKGWTPDFWFRFPCSHSECGGCHELYAEVKPYWSIAEFAGHPVTQIDPWDWPSPACFGLHPLITYWVMSHGAGGGVHSVVDGYDGELAQARWAIAGAITQWRRSDDARLAR